MANKANMKTAVVAHGTPKGKGKRAAKAVYGLRSRGLVIKGARAAREMRDLRLNTVFSERPGRSRLAAYKLAVAEAAK